MAFSSNWSRRASALLLFLLLLGTVLLPADPASAQPESRVLPQLLNEASSRPRNTFRVIVQRIRGNADADRVLANNGGRKLRELPGVDAFVATLPGRSLAALGQHRSVKFINYDAPLIRTGFVSGNSVGTVFPATVGANSLWAAGTTGLGVGVAVVDSGVAANLPDWRDATGRSRVVASVEFSSLTNSLSDAQGHGTHVAGIVAGNSWFNNSVPGKYVGIAPEANIISVKVSDDAGMSYTSDVVDAIEWVIANRTTHNIRVMNLSLVSSVPESYKTSILSAAVQRAWFSGILVVVSAGNSGPNTMAYPPANDPFVITVGAADSKGTTSPADDGIAPWSSYGTTQDGFSKPDVVAPGRYIASALASSSSTLAKNFPNRITDTNYIWMSGTSMAAPVVAGIAALAFEARPTLTNDQVKWLLMNTAQPLSGSPPGQGHGQVNARSVVNFLGTPGFANQGLAPSMLLVTPNGATSYSSANWSTANWSTANWSTANWSTANWSTANWSTANWSTANWSTATEQSVE
jgi:serine protease AprX